MKEAEDRDVKAQPVRLLDVFVLGPLMLYGAHLVPKRHRLVRAGLAVTGIGTIVCNAANYAEVERRRR